jgi:hypothetical protein
MITYSFSELNAYETTSSSMGRRAIAATPLGEVGVWCRLKEWEEFKTRGNCWFCLDKGEEYFRLQFLRHFNLHSLADQSCVSHFALGAMSLSNPFCLVAEVTAPIQQLFSHLIPTTIPP